MHEFKAVGSKSRQKASQVFVRLAGELVKDATLVFSLKQLPKKRENCRTTLGVTRFECVNETHRSLKLVPASAPLIFVHPHRVHTAQEVIQLGMSVSAFHTCSELSERSLRESG
jgi:hypothetical protein